MSDVRLCVLAVSKIKKKTKYVDKIHENGISYGKTSSKPTHKDRSHVAKDFVLVFIRVVVIMQ